jgi:hypothetical protein
MNKITQLHQVGVSLYFIRKQNLKEIDPSEIYQLPFNEL